MTSPWVGPEAVAASVESVLSSGMPLLLRGPAGVGKRKLATEAAEKFGKVLPVRTAGTGATAAVSSLLDTLSVRSPRNRVVLADLAAGTHPKILNRLLKTLEEPPPATHFILTSSAPVLPTISSRCVTVSVPTLPSSLVAAALLGLTKDELEAAGVSGMDPDRAWWAARSSQGRVGAALGLLGATDALPRAKSILRASVESDQPAWLAALAGLASAHDEALRARTRSEAVSVVLLLKTWALEVLTLGGSGLLDETYGAERSDRLVSELFHVLTDPAAGRNPALAVRKGTWSAVYS